MIEVPNEYVVTDVFDEVKVPGQSLFLQEEIPNENVVENLVEVPIVQTVERFVEKPQIEYQYCDTIQEEIVYIPKTQ